MMAAPKEQTKQISFKALLLLVFLGVQFLLFLTFDLPPFLHSLLDRMSYASSSKEPVLQSSTGSGVLGADWMTEEGPPVKTDNGRTAILIAGIDSRNVILQNGEFINPEPNGTRHVDSIMQLVLDHRSNELFQISIPRDTGVDVRLDCYKFSGNIHWLYHKGMNSKCPGKGLEVLEAGVESVTGIKSQYHVMISLEAFPKIIEAVGEKDENGRVGIFVENTKAFYELYPADDNKGWENLYFPAGRLFLTPRRALQYARSRQFSSDYARAARQQLVVQAVLERLVSMNVLSDPARIQQLIDVFNERVLMSEPQSLNELIGMISVAKEVDVSKIHHIVLDPDFGGAGREVYLNRQPHDRLGPYYMVPTAWNECPGDEYCKVKEKINEYFANPSLLSP